MATRKSIVVLAVMVVVIAAVTFTIIRLQPGSTAQSPTASPPRTPATSAEVPETAAYAYITEQKFVLMRGTRRLAEVKRMFDPSDSASNRVVWTPTGDYVAFFSDEQERHADTAHQQLIYVNTHTGAEHRASCPNCWDLTTTGTNTVITAGGTTATPASETFLSFDLDRGPGAGHSLDLPLDIRSSRPIGILGGSRGHLFTHQYVDNEQGGELIQVVDPQTRAVASLPVVDSTEHMPAAAAVNADTIAVALRNGPGECVTDFPIILVQGDGKEIETDQSSVRPSGFTRAVAEGIDVTDVWWGQDGRLRATMASWTCGETSKHDGVSKQLASPPTLWRLDGRKWVKDDATTATMLRLFDVGWKLALVLPNCVGPNVSPDEHCTTGDLSMTDGRTTTKIADDVLSISTQPRA